MEFDSILPSIAAGKADFGAAGMTVDAERQKNADFTDTYANASQVVIVRNNHRMVMRYNNRGAGQKSGSPVLNC